MRKHFADVAGPDAVADTIPNAHANADANANANSDANTDADTHTEPGSRRKYHFHRHTESGAMDGRGRRRM